MLPLGTFNHYARDLGVPDGLQAAVAALAGATSRRLDLAEVNGHRFLNNSAIGYYSQVVRERAEPRVRTRLAKMLVTAAAAVRLLGKYRLSEVCLTVEGRRITCLTPLCSSPQSQRHALFRFGQRPAARTGSCWSTSTAAAAVAAVLHTLLYAALRDMREDSPTSTG